MLGGLLYLQKRRDKGFQALLPYNPLAQITFLHNEAILALIFLQIERSAAQVVALAYKLAKAQQLTNTPTH